MEVAAAAGKITACRGHRLPESAVIGIPVETDVSEVDQIVIGGVARVIGAVWTTRQTAATEGCLRMKAAATNFGGAFAGGDSHPIDQVGLGGTEVSSGT